MFSKEQGSPRSLRNASKLSNSSSKKGSVRASSLLREKPKIPTDSELRRQFQSKVRHLSVSFEKPIRAAVPIPAIPKVMDEPIDLHIPECVYVKVTYQGMSRIDIEVPKQPDEIEEIVDRPDRNVQPVRLPLEEVKMPHTLTEVFRLERPPKKPFTIKKKISPRKEFPKIEPYVMSTLMFMDKS